jgi:hypothetical protein
MDKHMQVLTSHELDSTKGSTAIVVYSGEAFDIFNPQTWVFDIDDIAKALSNTCRFAGHVEFYSVAEHCMRVSDYLKAAGYAEHVQLLGLMHDAIEAYIGDIPRPIKKTFKLDGEPITELEDTMERAMFHAFDLLSDDFDREWSIVKKADIAIYEEERDERPNVGQGLLPNAACRLWLQHYYSLRPEELVVK